jgi:hypothetical protein
MKGTRNSESTCVLLPGSSKEIACLLVEKTSGGKIQKAKEDLRNKRKKSGATTMESTVA